MAKVVLGFLFFTCLLSPVWGQTVEFAVQYRGDSVASGEVLFNEIESGSGSAGLRLSAGEELELGVQLREAGSLATVGNLVSTLAAHGSTGGRYRLELTSRATLGPAALRIRGSVSDGRWAPWAPRETSFPALPRLGAGPAILGLEAGLTYRLSRQLVFDATPALFTRAGSWGGRFNGELRLLRAFSGNDVALLLNAFVEPGASAASGAAGVRYTLNRRRAPSWSGSLLLGLGPAGLWPGARLSGSERLETGKIELELHLAPYRLGSWPYLLTLGYEHALGEGDLRLGLQTGLEPGDGWRLAARAGYRLPFAP